MSGCKEDRLIDKYHDAKHHLSTIQNADQIVVLKKGRIVDCGKQEELLKRCPLYAEMWKAHIGAKNWSVSEKKEVAAHV